LTVKERIEYLKRRAQAGQFRDPGWLEELASLPENPAGAPLSDLEAGMILDHSFLVRKYIPDLIIFCKSFIIIFYSINNSFNSV
jgi:hypothetical protein